MVILHVGTYLHLVTYPAFHDGAKGVARRALWKGEFGVAVGHAFGADEDKVEGGAGEHVGELDPDFAREGRFGTCSEDEDTDRGWGGAEAFDVEACA